MNYDPINHYITSMTMFFKGNFTITYLLLSIDRCSHNIGVFTKQAIDKCAFYFWTLYNKLMRTNLIYVILQKNYVICKGKVVLFDLLLEITRPYIYCT